MKFLVSKFYLSIYFFLYSFIFASECIDTWYQSNIDKLDNNFIFIQASTYPLMNKKNIDSLTVYVDKEKNKVKIDLSNEVFLFDQYKSARLIKNLKQLYIDSPDSSMFILLSSIFNLQNIKPAKRSKFEYLLNLNSNFNKTRLFFSDDCSELESIRISIDKANIIIKNIHFSINDSLFRKDVFEIKGDYTTYDLRR